MSGLSDSTSCPECGGLAVTYHDWKPTIWSELHCLDCGHAEKSTTVESQLNEQELEDLRDAWGYYPENEAEDAV